jgi:ribosomal protein L20
MANWSRKKVIKLARGFKNRANNCFGIAIRKVHKAA